MIQKKVEIGKQAPLVRRVASIALALLILFYIGYQIWVANYQPLKFETATWAEAADSVQTTGYVIRQETVIPRGDSNGVVGYRLRDGDRISKEGVVADVFTDSDAASASQQVEQLDAEITRLESLNQAGETYAADIQQIDSRIDERMMDLLLAIRGCDAQEIQTQREELTYQMNQRQIAVGTDVDYSAYLQELKEEKKSLEEKADFVTGQITAPVSGYFSSVVDGWESVFDYDNALNLTVDDLTKEYQPQEEPEDAVGKISQEFMWYFACVVDPTTALKLKDAGTVNLSMPFATTEKIQASVAAVNQEDPNSDAAVILRCGTMNSSLANIRHETVQIEIYSYSGVMVNQKAIHFETVEQTVTDANGKERTVVHENVKGVYVKSGSQLHFVQIFTDITVNGYAICNTNLTDEQKEQLVTDDTIQLYDEVVVEGTDLYDEKVV